MIENLKAKDIMNQNFKRISEQDTLSKALFMFDESVDVLIVFDKYKEYSGVLTERMILRSGLSRDRTRVATLKANAPKISLETRLPEIARLMIENDIFKLPVFVGKQLVGVVADTEVLNVVKDKPLGNHPVRYYISNDVYFASPKDSIASVLRMFREFHISRMPVVENGELIGIITLHDIIEKVLNAKERPSFGHIIDEKGSVLELPVENVMNFPVHTCKIDTTVREVINTMLEWGINSIVVIDDRNKVIGIVTRRDLLEPISEQREKLIYPIIQFSSKIENLPKFRLAEIIKRFISKYSAKLHNSRFYIYMTEHKETLKNQHLIYTRLKLSCNLGLFHVRAEGWGHDNSLRNALLKLEKELFKRAARHAKKLKRAEKQQLLDYIEIESLS